MKMKLIFGFLLGYALAVNSFADIENIEIKKIRELVEKSYANGAFNKLDTEAMRKGFHHEFEIFSKDGDAISRYPLTKWIAGVEKRKAAADFDPAKYVYEYEFKSIKQAGNAAAVEIIYSQKTKRIYRDFLLLLKFDNGWEIVSKVYHTY
jgi:hypothetical protein